jgi:CheY-like chemotaxis protein
MFEEDRSVLVVGGDTRERERRLAALPRAVAAGEVPDGTAALERLTADVDVLLVDHGLQDYTPSEFITTARERGYAVRGLLLRPSPPEYDPVQRGFDAWLRTPVDPDSLVESAGTVLACRAYDDALRALYHAAVKQAGGVRPTRDRVKELRTAADEALAAVDSVDARALLANAPRMTDD